MIRISVVVITFNEERNLARCLESVRGVADEIVVVDSSSTDATCAIATSYGARVIQQPFLGYGQQKNFATQHASYDWILSLDADEALTPGLIHSIEEIKLKGTSHVMLQIPRLTNYCGQWIKHCGWYPDRQKRLYNRTKGRWVEQQVHEYWQAQDGNTTGTLTGDLLHYSFGTIAEHVKKIDRYSELAARDAVARGKNASILKVLLSPWWHFFSEFVLRLGFLDGYYGYIICRLSAYGALVKYAKIRQYYKQAQRAS